MRNDHDYVDAMRCSEDGSFSVASTERMTKYLVYLLAGRFRQEHLDEYRSKAKAAQRTGTLTQFRRAPLVLVCLIQKHTSPDSLYALAKNLPSAKMITRELFKQIRDLCQKHFEQQRSGAITCMKDYSEQRGEEIDEMFEPYYIIDPLNSSSSSSSSSTYDVELLLSSADRIGAGFGRLYRFERV